MSIEVIRAGARTSLELPFGTRGRAHEGISVGGAFDSLGALAANRTAGSHDDATMLEIVLSGPRLRFRADAVIAIAGAPFHVQIDDVSIAVPTGALPVRAGQLLTVTSCAHGVRCALAVRGGWLGVPGRVVTGDAVLQVGRATARAARDAPAWSFPAGDVLLRVTQGPQSAPIEVARLLASTWRVDPASDRAGVRLERSSIDDPLHEAPPASPAARSPGSRFVERSAGEMITAGVSVGAIQLPHSGAPIILGVDRATTGGYPVIAHVARVDLWKLGQLRPGAPVRFAWVSFDEARELWRAWHRCTFA